MLENHAPWISFRRSCGTPAFCGRPSWFCFTQPHTLLRFTSAAITRCARVGSACSQFLSLDHVTGQLTLCSLSLLCSTYSLICSILIHLLFCSLSLSLISALSLSLSLSLLSLLSLSLSAILSLPLSAILSLSHCYSLYSLL